MVISFTTSLWPDDSPFSHSLLRERLKNVAKPVSTVLSKRLLIHEADHQHAAGGVVLNDGGNEAVEFRIVQSHVCINEKPAYA